MATPTLRPAAGTWAEISLPALRKNYETVCRAAGKRTVCPVLKADAYGHGADFLGRFYEECGASYFAVATLGEAVALRQSGVAVPILILGYTSPENAALLAECRLSQCVFSASYAKALAENAAAAKTWVRVHIKVDTGLSRLGFAPGDIAGISAACRLPGLVPEGIFTHLAVADGESGDAYTRRQITRFYRTVAAAEGQGIHFALRHVANSAALFDHPEAGGDMVRPGIVLYGYPPSANMRRLPPLSPALTLWSTVAQIRRLKRGQSVGYGRAYVAPRPRKIATVPIGYADGVLRADRGFCPEICGRPAPLVGTVCMDQCMLDVTDIPGVTEGTPVCVYGDAPYNTVEATAVRCGTIPYEVLTAIGKRVPRYYIG